MKDIKCKIISNDPVAEGYNKMVFKADWDGFKPGQFVMIKSEGSFLRKPFGIASFEKGAATICYKIVGKGTASLCGLKTGSSVQVLGPLGNGFTLAKNSECILVAGGYGIFPLYGLARELKKNKCKIDLFYGARSKDHLLYLDEFKELGASLNIATEDGSQGSKGLVTVILESFLRKTHDAQRVTLYSCGPDKMLEAVQKIALKNKDMMDVCEFSLEAYMGCGIGVCQGCVIKDSAGDYVRVCKEGPVFDLKSLQTL